MKSMKEDQLRISKPEKSRMFKEMHEYVMGGIEVWEGMKGLAGLRGKSPEQYEKQKTELLSRKNLHYVINIAVGISDDDLDMRKEAIMLLRGLGVDNADVKLELTSIRDDGLEVESIRNEASKALKWHTLN